MPVREFIGYFFACLVHSFEMELCLVLLAAFRQKPMSHLYFSLTNCKQFLFHSLDYFTKELNSFTCYNLIKKKQMPLKGFPLFVASFVICVCVCIFFLSFFHFYMRFFFLFFLYKKYPLTNYNNTENTQYCFVRLRQIPSFVLDAFFLFI